MNRGPFMFGVARGNAARLKPRVRRAYERIAREHGAALVEAVIPGAGYMRWFEAPHHGTPFDDATARAVYAAIEAKLGGAR